MSMGYTLLRYFNASGADPDGRNGEDRRHEAHLIPLTFQVAVGRREKLLIYGDDWDTRDGTCVRDYVHTDDLAQAHQLAVESLEPGVARAYNLGSGTGVTCSMSSAPARPSWDEPIRHEIVGPTARRPGYAHRESREDHQGTGLVAPLHRYRRNRRDRLAMAQ